MPRSATWTGLPYVNTGDWVESCTAVVEHFDGRLEIIEWAAQDPAATPSPENETGLQAFEGGTIVAGRIVHWTDAARLTG